MQKFITDRVITLVALAGVALSVSGRAAGQIVRNPAVRESRVQAAKAPYTAEYKIIDVQTLANGTRIMRETAEIRALDSQGRRMNATAGTGKGTPVMRVMVYDPVARTQSFWHTPGKVAHVLRMSEGAESHCQTITRDDVHVPSGPHAQYTSEDIGTESIKGIEARRTRRTTTIPAGAAGNNEPLVTTSETWTAVTGGLDGLILRQITDDPRRGRSDRELTSLSQGEPDAATFQPPEGYEIESKDSPGCQDGPPGELRSGPPTSKPTGTTSPQ